MPCERLAERWLIPHPFRCEMAMCANVIAWHRPACVIPGRCDEHTRAGFTVPIAIYGYAGVGWSDYPIGVGHYVALAQRGAWRDDGTARPVAEWSRPPDD